MSKRRTLSDLYRFPGCRPKKAVKGIFGDPRARVIKLERRKKICGVCGTSHRSFYDRKTRLVRDLSCSDARIYLELDLRRVQCRRCGKVKQEKLPFLADSPFYTKRFVFYIGKRCESSTIKDIAKEFYLDWRAVKEFEKQYMREKLRRAGRPNPKVIGIDEISIRRRHNYRIVVSYLEKERPIWFGGEDRSEENMNLFYDEIGPVKSGRIRLALMDMGKTFEKSIRQKAPQVAILYDKFHVIRHWGEALDTVRKS